MKKDISFNAYVERAKEMAYLMVYSAVTFILFAVFSSLSF